MSNISYRKVLKQEKQFCRRLLAQAFSRFGDSVDQITFSWLMYSLTNNASLLALSLFFNFLPTILLQPFAGPLAERYKKQKILFLCDAGRALLTVLAAVCFLQHILSPGLLIALTLCNSTLEAFQMPASSGALPLLLQDEHLESGISLNAALSRGVEIAGQGAAGLLLGSLGAAGALLIDGSCFVVSAFLCLSLHIPEKQPASAFSLSSYLQELKGGFQMLFSLRRVLLFALTCTAINFLLSPVNAYQSAYISGDLHFGPQMLSAVGVATSLGIMLGSFLAPAVRRLFPGRRFLCTMGTALAAAYLALWYIPFLHQSLLRAGAALGAMLLLGFSIGAPSVWISAMLTRSIPGAYMARVQGITGAFSAASIPLGALTCAGLAAFITVPQAHLLFAGLALLFALASRQIKSFSNI